MALFQPTNITPDLRSGVGNGVVDVTAGMKVSWRINGQSAMTNFRVAIYTNDTASTLLYTTGRISTGCPAYGTTSTGEPKFFSYTISASTLSGAGVTNGNSYKMIIRQWWTSDDSVTQSSASVFLTRAAPSLSIAAIGTGGVISNRSYTFTGNYSQANGDVINYFRWQIANQDDRDNPIMDSGNVSGTMDISCSYWGFLNGGEYSIRLTAQTENGVEADTGWVDFSCSYTVYDTTGELTAGCVGGTDAIYVEWSGIGYIPGTASGSYKLDKSKGLVTLQSDSTITWDYVGTGSMNFAAPWSVVWKGSLTNADATLFTIGQSTGDITLTYTKSNKTLTLKKGSTTLVSQNGITNEPTVTVILTATNLYIRSDYYSGGLFPNTTRYPATNLYPKDDDTPSVGKYTLSPSYTQAAITSVQIGGYQVCDYIEVINGAAGQSVISAAYDNGTYSPEPSDTDYMLAQFTSGIDAGTLDFGGQTVTAFDLFRRRGTESKLSYVITPGNTISHIYDYGAASQQGPYTYYLFLRGANSYVSPPLVSGTVMPCWWSWTLMECTKAGSYKDYAPVYLVQAAYRFRLNVESGAVSNNNTPSLLPNFTPYPKIQISPQNYKSGTLSGLIGVVEWKDGQPKYRDTIEWRDALYALSTSQNQLFLKNRKGDILRIKISAPITMTTDDKTREQAQTMSLPWVEVGSAKDVSLCSLGYRGVQSPRGKSTPDYYIDTSKANGVSADILLGKKGYGKNGLEIGTATFTVNGTTLVAPKKFVSS